MILSKHPYRGYHLVLMQERERNISGPYTRREQQCCAARITVIAFD